MGSGVSAGAFFVRFDSTYKYSDANSGEQAFVDMEGQLDLPTNEVVGNIAALWVRHIVTVKFRKRLVVNVLEVSVPCGTASA